MSSAKTATVSASGVANDRRRPTDNPAVSVPTDSSRLSITGFFRITQPDLNIVRIVDWRYAVFRESGDSAHIDRRLT